MERTIILHIGLHKTATRFLQRDLFQNLDSTKYNYNPENIRACLTLLIKNPTDTGLAKKAKQLVADLSDDRRNLIISMPDLSGNMFDNQRNYRANLSFLVQVFPEAEIIYFVRRHSDWLLSAYKQSLHKGSPGPIEVFLNYYNGEFKDKYADRVAGMRNLETLKLDFLNIYNAYKKEYGGDHVHLFRYEDFKDRRNLVLERLKQIINIEELPPLNTAKVKNRGFSALAIRLFYGGLKLPKKPPEPTPVYSAFRRKHSISRIISNLKRNLVKHIFDRIYYKDWDLLARGGMREKIDEHYKAENQKIKVIADEDLSKTVSS